MSDRTFFCQACGHAETIDPVYVICEDPTVPPCVCGETRWGLAKRPEARMAFRIGYTPATETKPPYVTITAVPGGAADKFYRQPSGRWTTATGLPLGDAWVPPAEFMHARMAD